MRLTIRIDEKNLHHIHFTVFANGGNCGRLTMRTDEFRNLQSILRVGAGPNQSSVEFRDESKPAEIECEMPESVAVEEADAETPSTSFWRCDECGYEDHAKPMPKDRDKFYAQANPERKCSGCKSMSLMPVGF